MTPSGTSSNARPGDGLPGDGRPHGDPANGRARPRMSAARKRRITTLGLVAIVALAFVLPLGGYALHALGLGGDTGGFGTVQAQDDPETPVDAAASGVDLARGTSAENRSNARSDYWRAVNGGVAGYSAVEGPGANVLVERGGTNWQALRSGPIASILPWAILAMAAILFVFHLIFGRKRLDKPLSGAKIKRWGWFDRLVHWVTAISFIVLAVTGLSMLIGRELLIPVLGKAGFAFWAQASISVHNIIGPLFSVGVVCMIALWIWHNFPEKGDLQWLKQGGGMFSDAHPPAGRMNAGEKLWFWLVASVGVLVCLSGYVLVAPIYGLELPFIDGLRPEMRGASIVHAVLAIVWTAVALGHIYIGTAGTEGAFEGMATGYVSTEWAEQHHDRWYAEMVARGQIVPPGASELERHGEPAETDATVAAGRGTVPAHP